MFSNLIINAVHAIDEGDAEHNEIRVRTWSEAANVCAEVSDTGSNIVPEHLERLFEPFFSTKQVGKGSGLGLAVSKNIVESYGGTIAVQSTLGEGTVVTVRLPIRDEETDATCTEYALGPSPQDVGRVLVVDDEERIRTSVARMVRRHEVVQAESGAAAQHILEQDEGFGVILCDMMMPEVSGMNLHQWFLERSSALAERLIFVTESAFTPRARLPEPRRPPSIAKALRRRRLSQAHRRSDAAREGVVR